MYYKATHTSIALANGCHELMVWQKENILVFYYSLSFALCHYARTASILHRALPELCVLPLLWFYVEKHTYFQGPSAVLPVLEVFAITFAILSMREDIVYSRFYIFYSIVIYRHRLLHFFTGLYCISFNALLVYKEKIGKRNYMRHSKVSLFIVHITIYIF